MWLDGTHAKVRCSIAISIPTPMTSHPYTYPAKQYTYPYTKVVTRVRVRKARMPSTDHEPVV